MLDLVDMSSVGGIAQGKSTLQLADSELVPGTKERQNRPQRKVQTRSIRARVAPLTDYSKCVCGTCEHTRARNWVQCERCTQWYHCVCVKISLTKARDGTPVAKL
ncbi:hypothetical protein GBAR_LOCUS22402, partial [Geodia barretti]